MSDETRKDEALTTEKLTTADLARTGDRDVRQVDVESSDAGDFRSRPDGAANPTDVFASTGAAAATATVRARSEEESGPLFAANESDDLRRQWDQVQVGFVDEPRQAVEEADRLIAATMKRLAEIFAAERQNLEHQWDRGDNVSTEDLRVALRRYRSFFSRMLRV